MKRYWLKRVLLPLVFLILWVDAWGQIPDLRVRMAEDFLHQLMTEQYDSAVQQFDSVLTARLPASTLRVVWETLQKQVGSFQQYENYYTMTCAPWFTVFLTCRFEKALLDLKLVYSRDQKIAGMFFLPARHLPWHVPPYVDTAKFHVEPIEIRTDSIVLQGELTTPADKKIYPVVVLVHGSGPNDRDETIGPVKVFRDIAYGLSSNGIAVLRYDKRTFSYGRKMDPEHVTVWEESIEDAVSAVRLAEKIPGASAVFLLGHSLGAYLAPRIAGKVPGLTGMILLAGNTRPLEDLILEQMTYLLSLDGLSAEDSARLENIRRKTALVKSKSLTADTPRRGLPSQLNASYWLDLRNYDPVATAQKLNKPMLIMQGGRDYQVTKEDFEGWEKGLENRENVTFRFYPDLNHLFMTGEGKSTPDEYMREGHVSGKVIGDITDWINKYHEAILQNSKF
ncbi:MAG: alpha/beta fold hydrolase [Bacteroidales bacterium]|nr:alpha/beta fold hydrolase [Bacteroidales bacterium]